MGLPGANFSFTIPSIHDDSRLQCRLYHPRRPRNPIAAAVVAHPYAPLGGSYDDPVVHAVGSTMLDAGFIVGTFNFRGASGSEGRTSWSAKPELADYVSFYGFMLYYLSGLQISSTISRKLQDNSLPDSPSSPSQAAFDETITQPKDPYRPILVLGGYSYGSMIASRLPSIDTVKSQFRSPEPGSAEAEVRLRALRLSKEYIKAKQEQEIQQQSRGRSGLNSPDSTLTPKRSMAMGVFGSESTSRRPSHESRRSVDSVRKSLDHVRERLHVKRMHNSENDAASDAKLLPDLELVEPKLCYLLISPLLPPVSAFATMFTRLSFPRQMKSPPARGEDLDCGPSDDKLVLHRSLAIYGDRDVFTSHKKLRRWAEVLQSKKPESHFQFQEIEGAGHFWHEEGVESQMRKAVRKWVDDM